MQKLHVGFMKDLRNREFDSLYGYIIKVMNAHKLDDGNIKIAFERVKPHI